MRAVSRYVGVVVLLCGVTTTLALAETGEPVDARGAIRDVAHLEELCTRDPAHTDCSPERRAAACSRLQTATIGAAGVEDEAEEPLTSRLAGYVAAVMIGSACGGVEDPSPEDDRELFRRVFLDRHKTLGDLARRFQSDLDQWARSMRQYASNLRSRMDGLEGFAATPEDATFTVDGRPVERRELVYGMCAGIPDMVQALIREYDVFLARYANVPAARYRLDLLEAKTFNALARAIEVLPVSDCAEHAPVADEWRVGLSVVKPDRRLTSPEDPATRGIGMGVESARARVAGSLDELGALLLRVPPAQQAGVCATLESRMQERFQPAWAELRRTSHGSRYHFVRERATQLELLREAYQATATLVDTCGRDADPAPWRDDYLRHVIAMVGLLEPPLGRTLSRYLASRFDVDMTRAP